MKSLLTSLFVFITFLCFCQDTVYLIPNRPIACKIISVSEYYVNYSTLVNNIFLSAPIDNVVGIFVQDSSRADKLYRDFFHYSSGDYRFGLNIESAGKSLQNSLIIALIGTVLTTSVNLIPLNIDPDPFKNLQYKNYLSFGLGLTFSVISISQIVKAGDYLKKSGSYFKNK